MVSFISHTSVDSGNAYAQSVWWAAVLGYVEIPGDPNAPEHDECAIQSPDGQHRILFINVPEAKSVKNRLHFDLRPADRTRDEEVVRLVGLGARPVADFRQPNGSGWVVLVDPEGNEFCVLRSLAEVHGQAQPTT